MLHDSREQHLEGFGRWEFPTLLGTILGKEARDVRTVFMEDWDFDNPTNVHLELESQAEQRRNTWRVYKRDRTAYLTLPS